MPAVRKRIAVFAAAVTITAVGVAVPAPLAAAVAGVDPSAVELTLAPGASSAFSANVTTPAVVPDPDIVFLADTTGSMDPALANVRNNLPAIIDDIRAVQPSARFGVAEYKEQFDGDRVFRVDAPLTDDKAAAVNGAQQWLYNVGGGGQPGTDFINAHFQLATGAVAFRPRGARVIAWFGDARSNDPSLGHTLADTVNSLRANGIRVIAVPVTGTSGPGLDERGQATSITNGTSGVLMPTQGTGTVADAILAGIEALSVAVTPAPACDPRLTLTTAPTTRTVRSGTAASFTENVAVRPDAAAGTYRCTVDFQVNGQSVGYTQTVTVHVPGTQPALRISDVTVDEGDSGTTPATLTVSMDRASTQEVTVGWSTVDGTATAGDFAAGNGTLTFAPGETSEQVTIGVTGDQADEPDETFTVHLSNATGATIADADGVVTILDDDGTPPTLRIGDAAGPEGNVGTTPATLTVTLDQASTQPVTVPWTTTPGTAGVDDFVAASGELTFAPGETSEQITVQTRGDRTPEGSESFLVELTGTTIAGSVTINDDDTDTSPGEVPALRIGDVTVPEGDAASSPATVTVVLDQVSDVPVNVRWATEDGTATAPGDYTAGSDVLTFEPGTTSRQITVPVAGDRSFEQTETFSIELSEPVGATVADGSAVVAIDNDDEETGPAVLTIDDVAVAENAGQAVPAVRLSAAQSSPVSVRVATRAGTAGADDYQAVDTTVTFAPGDTVASVPVGIVDDAVPEQDETFAVELSEPSGATVADSSAVVTILDDDDHVVRPSVSVADTSVREDAGPAGFEVRLSEPAPAEVTVAWATGDGTAVAPADYTAASGTVVFTPGQVTALVPVTVVDDAVYEGDETFTLTLSEPSGATIGDGTAVGTIVDDETATPGVFRCAASAADLLGTRPAVAGGTPCVDDAATAARVKLGLGLLTVRVDGLTATTDAAPGGVSAGAGLLTTRISTIGLVIDIGAITSSATATCVSGPAGPAPSFAGSSSIAWLRVNGVAVSIGSGPVTIPLVVGSLTLNSTVSGPDGLRQRAFDLRTVLGNVVIGESSVGATGNPCLS